MAKELVQFWKGNEDGYKKLYVRGRIKDNVRYTVKMNDGTIREYLGNDILDNSDLEQVAAVDNIISIDKFTDGLGKGEYTDCRLLVGDNKTFRGCKLKYFDKEHMQSYIEVFKNTYILFKSWLPIARDDWRIDIRDLGIYENEEAYIHD